MAKYAEKNGYGVFYLKVIVIILFLTICQSSSYAAQARSTEVSGAWLKISTAGPGSEFSLMHHEPASELFTLNAGVNRVDRYQLADLQGIFGLQMAEDKKWSLGVTFGYCPEGRVIPKTLFSLEGQLALGKGFSPVFGLRKQNYSDVSVIFFSLGVDYEPPVPWLFILRGYLTRTYFDLGSTISWNGAGLFKLVFTGLPEYKFFGFASYGTEGVLRGVANVVDTLNSWTIGLGAEKELFENFLIKPQVDYQKYPTQGIEIYRTILGVEKKW